MLRFFKRDLILPKNEVADFFSDIYLFSLIRGSGQVGFVVDKVALGRVFSEHFGFP
jgi:hypothetical protein